jgi:hypothetical protein
VIYIALTQNKMQISLEGNDNTNDKDNDSERQLCEKEGRRVMG